MYFALLPIASYRSRLLVNMVFEFSSFVDAFIRVTLTFNQDSYESLLFELMPCVPTLDYSYMVRSSDIHVSSSKLGHVFVSHRATSTNDRIDKRQNPIIPTARLKVNAISMHHLHGTSIIRLLEKRLVLHPQEDSQKHLMVVVT